MSTAKRNCYSRTTRRTRAFFGQPKEGHWKDAFHQYVVHGDRAAVNHDHRGTKAAAHFRFTVPAGKVAVAKVRLTKANNPSACGSGTQGAACPVGYFDSVFAERIREADAYYADLQKELPSDDARLVQRQAFAGLIWTKQFYHYDVPVWLDGDPNPPPPPQERKRGRNSDWAHLNNADIISMPDKWEYPWYAAWDLAFHWSRSR